MEREEAQAVLTVFYAAFLSERPEIRVRFPSRMSLLDEGTWEQQLHGRFLERFGSSLLPLPDSLEHSRFLQALKLSPRYMGAGIREAAQELFTSPLFVVSMGLSVLVYLALACVRLYRESEAARSEEALEAASERFGKSVGGTGLRVMVLVASFGIGKAMPSVPHGGLGALLGSPRYAVEGGLLLGGATTARDNPVDGISFRKPDIASTRPDGLRHNTNYVSDPAHLKRELTAFEALVRADKWAIHELYLLDGTLIRRYVPRGASYP